MNILPQNLFESENVFNVYNLKTIRNSFHERYEKNYSVFLLVD